MDALWKSDNVGMALWKNGKARARVAGELAKRLATSTPAAHRRVNQRGKYDDVKGNVERSSHATTTRRGKALNDVGEADGRRPNLRNGARNRSEGDKPLEAVVKEAQPEKRGTRSLGVR